MTDQQQPAGRGWYTAWRREEFRETREVEFHVFAESSPDAARLLADALTKDPLNALGLRRVVRRLLGRSVQARSNISEPVLLPDQAEPGALGQQVLREMHPPEETPE